MKIPSRPFLKVDGKFTNALANRSTKKKKAVLNLAGGSTFLIPLFHRLPVAERIEQE